MALGTQRSLFLLPNKAEIAYRTNARDALRKYAFIMADVPGVCAQVWLAELRSAKLLQVTDLLDVVESVTAAHAPLPNSLLFRAAGSLGFDRYTWYGYDALRVSSLGRRLHHHCTLAGNPDPTVEFRANTTAYQAALRLGTTHETIKRALFADRIAGC